MRSGGAPAPVPRQPRRPVAQVTFEGGRRSSSRHATVQSKLEVQTKLKQAEERRASQPVRAPKRRKVLTQDALIAEALETEEENMQSLQIYLEQEEDRRARQRAAGKKVIHGPVLRWISTKLPQNVLYAREREDEKEDTKLGAPAVPDAGAATGSTQPTRPDVPTSYNTNTESAQRDAPNTPVKTEGPVLGQELRHHSIQPPALAATSTTASEAASQPSQPSQPASGVPLGAEALPPPTVPIVRPYAVPTVPQIPPAARELSPEDEDPEEPTARTILSFENLEPESTWVDEFRMLLGDHCEWDRVAVVPSRNRPFRPRQSTCVITGLPARYRDPQTGIPYATTEAYRTLRRVLARDYIWTGIAGHDTALSAGCFVTSVHDCGAGGVFSLQ